MLPTPAQRHGADPATALVGPRTHDPQGVARNHLLLVGRDDPDRGGMALRAEASRTGGIGSRIDRNAKPGAQGAEGLPDAVDEVVDRLGGVRVVAAMQVAQIIADPITVTVY